MIWVVFSLFGVGAVILFLQRRTYLMVKYLSGGRSWKGRFRTIKDKFARVRRARHG